MGDCGSNNIYVIDLFLQQGKGLAMLDSLVHSKTSVASIDTSQLQLKRIHISQGLLCLLTIHSDWPLFSICVSSMCGRTAAI